MGADLIMEWLAVPPGRDETACYSAAEKIIEEMEEFVKENPWWEYDENDERIGEEPNWGNLNKFAEQFGIFDPSWVFSSGNYFEEEYIWAVSGALKTMKDFTATYWRFATSQQIGEWTICVVGDSSWGDSPPEPWGKICTLKYSANKVWGALGYHWPKNCVPYSEEERTMPPKTHLQLTF